jgi:hypothetical protein
MHVLFVHTNFPGQFGCIAPRLASEYGWTCTFATERAGASMPGVEKLLSRPVGGATRATPVPARPFDTAEVG